ncbi:anthrax toxin-like adenylyl cyclase domain-containing protein [Pseudomonas batumici]|uniref:anthrax toxin-like adenylyl cyclase domain-containing protein n=1 Tax=Pseudomonas batumici TaxID=226910 RepID=UPI00058A202D|nr:anthrax toxin-like adenylyl cyclase domain-containing protein [Pseudomonas batumici]
MKLNLLRGLSAITGTGMPIEHGRAFQQVADAQKCVISVRAVGPLATGLLLEGYATKGFHNKAKSCTWGPMAGFVLADPRFTKNPDFQSQRKALQETVHSGAGQTPLYITDKRRKALENPLKCMTFAGGNNLEMHYTAADPSGAPIKFVLKQTASVAGANGEALWGVFYGPQERRLSNDLKEMNQAPDRASLLPVMAIVDSHCSPQVRDTYRAATTCDYDLWAVFPRRHAYSRSGADRRMVPDTDRFPRGMDVYTRHEHPDLGNMTPRIRGIRNALNTAVCAAGYRGGNVVHHSDEAGRPLVTDIDFPSLFFIPGEEAHCVGNVHELKQLLCVLGFDYVLGLNPGWHRQLGLTMTRQGHYEI